MKTLLSFLTISFFLLLISCTTGKEPIIVKFEGPSLEKKWALTKLNSELPADWESYAFLTFEMNATSTQRFDLKLYDSSGLRRVRIQPFQGAWVRTSIPLFRFKKRNTQGTTMSSTYQAGLPGCWINFGSGPFGPLSHVDSLGLSMNKPIGTPTVEIRNIHLSMVAEDSIFSPIPLVDEFGQWIPDEWPGKAKTIEELKAAWDTEDKELTTGNFNFSKFGGFLVAKVKPSGFFRVEKIDNKWWFVDPEGYLFYSIGSTGIGPRSEVSRIQGREYVFKAMPPATETAMPVQAARTSDRPVRTSDQAARNANQNTAVTGQPARAGNQGQRGPGASFLTWNLYRRFGPDWFNKWMDFTARRMDDWGLNTIANWSDNTLGSSRRKPYVANISGWGTNARTMGMPDVYASNYDSLVQASAARQCAPRKDDPFLIGYFIGNEPIWPDREADLIEIILSGESTPMQTALKKFLAGGDTPERRKEFVYKTYEKFVSIVDKAIKKYDPNHLNLGLRFGGSAPADLITASKNSFDVFSINIYGYEANPKTIQRIYDISELPIVIGEFHFGTPGRGLAPGLAQTSSQEERGVAYRYYVENVASHPAMIGTHWFQWMDQPSTGRNDGENYNIGYIDVTDRPYKEFIDAAKETHKRIFEIHSGKVPPVTRQALQQ
jgi:hypothetical protein